MTKHALRWCAARGLVSASSAGEVTFSCVVYADAVPALYFEPQWIADIAKLGAALDIDLYLSGAVAL
jgi:hypothetical protein